MKSADVFPSKYLKSADLRGHEPTVTISSVVMEEVGDGKKPVAYFSGKEKGLVINRTNWGMLEFLYGDESDDWAGKRITLFTVMTTDQLGKPVLGLRVKAPIKQIEQPKQEEPQVPRRMAAVAPQNGGLQKQERPWGTLMSPAIADENDDPLANEIPF